MTDTTALRTEALDALRERPGMNESVADLILRLVEALSPQVVDTVEELDAQRIEEAAIAIFVADSGWAARFWNEHLEDNNREFWREQVRTVARVLFPRAVAVHSGRVGREASAYSANRWTTTRWLPVRRTPMADIFEHMELELRRAKNEQSALEGQRAHAATEHQKADSAASKMNRYVDALEEAIDILNEVTGRLPASEETPK